MTHMQEEPAEARIGLVVDARFRIVSLLGVGGMATVYRAEHVRTGALVAIKVLHRHLSAHPEMSERFQREALAARSVQHPNVVSAMDFGRLDDGALYLVLEYIQGEELVTRLHRVGPLPASKAVHIASQVASALVAAHAAGVIHRDLKPENIMLIEREGDPDFAKVVDFGIAKLAVPSSRGQPLTALGSVFGTPEYMAPEQARGTAVDHRADLYTLGVVLYEMVSGKTPFSFDDPTEVIVAQISQPPPPLPAHVDPELAQLIVRLLAKDPGQRVQTAAELAELLRRWQERHESAAQPLAAPVRDEIPSAVHHAPTVPALAMPDATAVRAALARGSSAAAAGPSGAASSRPPEGGGKALLWVLTFVAAAAALVFGLLSAVFGLF